MKNCLTETVYNNAHKNLVEKSKIDFGFISLIIFSNIICVLGFEINNPSIIIGSMLISPLLYPILSISSTLGRKEFGLFSKILAKLSVIFLFLIALSTIVAYLVNINIEASEIIERIVASPAIYFAVAVCSGLAAMIAFYWPGIVEAIPGIAISVALLPPVSIVGIAISVWDVEKINSSLLIVILNVLGIILGSLLALMILNFMACRKKRG